MPNNHVQEIPTEWADASKLVDYNGVERVCRVIGSDGRGMFADFCCFKAINRNAGKAGRRFINREVLVGFRDLRSRSAYHVFSLAAV